MLGFALPHRNMQTALQVNPERVPRTNWHLKPRSVTRVHSVDFLPSSESRNTIMKPRSELVYVL